MSISDDRTVTVEVLSDQQLLAETIGAALTSRGRTVVRRPWVNGASRHGGARTGADVGLLIGVLDDPLSLTAAMAVTRQQPGYWSVITDTPLCAAWGVALEAGATGVHPATMTLDELDGLVERASRGKPAMPPPAAQAALARARAVRPDVRAHLEGLARLTASERRVLRGLHQGRPVHTVAERLGVSEATVRSQVQSVLRKLGVSGQIAAVAVLDSLATSELFTD